MNEESWIKEVLLGIFGGLATLSSLLAGRLWIVQDARIQAVEDQQDKDRETMAKGMEYHANLNAAARDMIRRDLAEEISRLYNKVDQSRVEIKGDIANIVTLIQRQN